MSAADLGMNSALITKKKKGANIILLIVILSAEVMPPAYVFDNEYVKVIVSRANCGLRAPCDLRGRAKGIMTKMEEGQRIASLRRSILFTTSAFFIAQCALFLIFAVSAKFTNDYWSIFLPISVGFHVFLLIMLLLFQDDFTIETTGRKLSRVNLANMITISRVSTMPTLLVLVIAAKHYRIRIPLLILVALIFLTDFFDGRISRKTNQVTRVGRMMDSASDYTLLVVLSVIFRYYSLIPGWFFALVLSRLGIQAMMMATLIAVKRRIEPKSTLMGKVTVASIMVLYTLEIIKLVLQSPPLLAFRIAEWIVAMIIVIGIFDKIVSFFDTLKGSPTGK